MPGLSDRTVSHDRTPFVSPRVAVNVVILFFMVKCLKFVR